MNSTLRSTPDVLGHVNRALAEAASLADRVCRLRGELLGYEPSDCREVEPPPRNGVLGTMVDTASVTSRKLNDARDALRDIEEALEVKDG
jgi:hypothetical protein